MRTKPLLKIATLLLGGAALGYWLFAQLPAEFSKMGLAGAVVGAGICALLGVALWNRRLPLFKPAKLEISAFGQKIELVVDESIRRAAWTLWIEYGSRITIVPLADGDGLLREALSSYYKLFEITRQVLKEAGPAAGDVAEPALRMLNEAIRPTLAFWHPALESWEVAKPADQSKAQWEAQWAGAEHLRQELKAVSKHIGSWIGELNRLAHPEKNLPALPAPVTGELDALRQSRPRLLGREVGD